MRKTIEIYSNDNFVASQCATCNIPGYIIFETKQNVKFLHEISSISNMFEILAKIEKKLYRVLKPENIYIAKFGEECRKVHFHIFPRTKEITESYLKQFPNTTNLNGPQIFDWARKEYKVNEGYLSQRTIEVIRMLRIKNNIICKTKAIQGR